MNQRHQGNMRSSQQAQQPLQGPRQQSIQIQEPIQYAELSMFEDWPNHTNLSSRDDLQNLIDVRAQAVLKNPIKWKYEAKIALQIFIYILNILELIFTLVYGTANKMEVVEIESDDWEERDTYQIYRQAYQYSIFLTIFLHCFAWIYTYIFMKTTKEHFWKEIIYYFVYFFYGIISYFKLAPFYFYFTRDLHITQYSFSQINKYLIMTDDDRFRNPTALFKDRKKSVNMFRELIFHRVALVSILITLVSQTIPQLFIQGFFNSTTDRWNAYNVFSYIFLLGGLIYGMFELQFLIYIVSYRTIQTELQLKLNKIKLKRLHETKQLLKADLSYLKSVKSYFIHIDPRILTRDRRRRCMVQLVKFLLTQKNLLVLEILLIDYYDLELLQYLSNCLQFLTIKKLNLIYEKRESLEDLQTQFGSQQHITYTIFDGAKINEWWTNTTIVQEQQIEQKQIEIIDDSYFHALQSSIKFIAKDLLKKNYITIGNHYRHYINEADRNQLPSIPKLASPIPQQAQRDQKQIIIDALTTIAKHPRSSILRESLGRLEKLVDIYEYFEKYRRMNQWQYILESFNSLWNFTFTIFQLIYIGIAEGQFQTALILLQILVPMIQMSSFTLFHHKFYPALDIIRKIKLSFLFLFSNFFKVWGQVMTLLYLHIKDFFPTLEVPFTYKAYWKFKSYAAKYKGTLATTVFKYDKEKLEPGSLEGEGIYQIERLPFYQAVSWRTNVEETIIKLPQFFIYIASLVVDDIGLFWILSITQSIKEGAQAIWNLIYSVVIDFLIPALALRSISTEQFFQSMSYLSSILNHIYVEFPSSFCKLSKVNSDFLRQNCSIQVEVKNLNYQNYKPLKLAKSLAQLRLVLCQIDKQIEFDSAERFFSMGPEIHDIFECLRCSNVKQFKLNFNLENVDPNQVKFINTLIYNCSRKIQFLQIQVSHSQHIPVNLIVQRKETMNAFQYSYLQARKILSLSAQVVQEEIIPINTKFVNIDRYDFEQFYLELSGKLDLSLCHEFLQQFQKLRVLKLNINHHDENSIQKFDFSKNLCGRNIQIIDITLENIELIIQGYDASNIFKMKLILKQCKFNPNHLYDLLMQINKGNVYVDLRQCDPEYQFDQMSYRRLYQTLKSRRLDVKILLANTK